MKNKSAQPDNSSFEKRILYVLCFLFVAVLASAWVYSYQVREKIASQASSDSVTQGALVQIENLRSLSESQMNKSLIFFLLGSSSLFDDQKKERQELSETLAAFVKDYELPGVSDITKRVEDLQQQRQEFFDQAMEHRSKQTESRIVGQFYRSKIAPLRGSLDKAFDEMATLYQTDYDHRKAAAQNTAIEAQTLIPKGMTYLTVALSLLFVALISLVVRGLLKTSRLLAERDRLYAETSRIHLSRDELVAGISNDLKEPLNEINFAMNNLTPDSAEVIKSSVELIDARVHDILDEAKAAAGNLTLRLDQMGLDDVLDDARLMMYPFAKQRDIRLEFVEVNPPVLAFLDRERIMRVLSNLVSNAIKFSPKFSKVIVRVRSDQQFVYVSVKDNGTGIPEKQIPHLFDRFWQASSSAEKGAGVGLSVAKSIVEAHGGVLNVESHLGAGTTFTFSLPRRRPAGLQKGRPVVATVKSGPRAIPESRIEPRTNSQV